MQVPNVTIDEARALVAEPKLWPRIRAFLWGFAQMLDPARVAAAFPPEAAGLLRTPYSPRFAKAILAQLGVAPLFYDFPAANGSRLLLLPREDYEAIARWLGFLLYAPRVRTVLNGAQVRALKRLLPGVYPEGLNYTAYFTKWALCLEAVRAALPEVPDPAADVEGFCASVRQAGMRMLASLLASVPEAVRARQCLRFPVADEPAFAPLPGNALSADRLDLLFLLLKLRFPEANDLCS